MVVNFVPRSLFTFTVTCLVRHFIQKAVFSGTKFVLFVHSTNLVPEKIGYRTK